MSRIRRLRARITEVRFHELMVPDRELHTTVLLTHARGTRAPGYCQLLAAADCAGWKNFVPGRPLWRAVTVGKRLA